MAYSQLQARSPEAARAGRPRPAAYWTDEQNDYLRPRGLYISHDERTWRQVPLTTAPKTTDGMAFTPDGTLLFADNNGGRLWRLPPGATTLEPVVDGPRVVRLEASGGVLIASPSYVRRTLAVSTDGKHWKTVKPGATMQ